MPDWQAILSREGPAVWQTAYWLLGNQADADECFQEAFLAALEVACREPVHCWRALLKRLAAARALDRLRQRRRHNSRTEVADLDSVPSTEPAPSQSVEDQELAQRLRTALAQLPPKQAEVFCLHCLDGESYEEIARHLTLSTGAVGVVLHRARQRLRKLLAADEGRMRPREETS
jgi:RNA polymerase sigma-70 factor (ECF subfamily)